MDRRDFLKAAVLGAAAVAVPDRLLAAAESLSAAGKPNIIFILADDLGWGNVSCFGADNFKTPRLDALAKGGVKFEQAYSTPLCGPSRCQIMTGRYPFRTGMISNGSNRALLPKTEVVIPKVMKTAGYVTAQIGKWNQLPLEPSDWGFDEYLRFNASGQYWHTQVPYYTKNGKREDLGSRYIPDVMHDFLVDFITRHKDQPFYAFYSMAHVHGPILRTPDTKPGTTDFYADNVAYMDKLVGKLVDELEKLKLREKTLIVFVGDNGTAEPQADNSTVRGRRLSGQKGSLLEGGSRVPMIANWPGTAPAGRTVKDLVDFSDFMATFAALGGAKLPSGVTIDGQNFEHVLRGTSGKSRDWVYVELNGGWYVRDMRYKLRGNGELLDLSDGPFVEKVIPADTTDADALAAKKRLQAVLDKLNPAAGKQEFKPLPQKKNRKKTLKELDPGPAVSAPAADKTTGADAGLQKLLGL